MLESPFFWGYIVWKALFGALLWFRKDYFLARINKWTTRDVDKHLVIQTRTSWMMCVHHQLEDEVRKVYKDTTVTILEVGDTFHPPHTALKWDDMAEEEKRRLNCEKGHDRVIRRAEFLATLSNGKQFKMSCRVASVRTGQWTIEEGSCECDPGDFLPSTATTAKVVSRGPSSEKKVGAEGGSSKSAH